MMQVRKMLSSADLSARLDRETYLQELPRHQKAIAKLARRAYLQQRGVILVFEGWDASGKGGLIRRITERLDPRSYDAITVNQDWYRDTSHHYLRRFWENIPKAGKIAIFDRSWYSRVLVERVEGICSPEEWRRAYREINQFEQQLLDFGTILLKFWLHITKEEQLRRFESRQYDHLRQWKLTEQDWRNRELWEHYETAVNDMLLKTSTIAAPWNIIPAESKEYARVNVMETMIESISQSLDSASKSATAEDDKPESVSKKRKKKKKK
jgi:polyphosphate kinase 2 (PPK2 family)